MSTGIGKQSRKLQAIDRTRRNVAAIEVYNGGEAPLEMRLNAASYVFPPGITEVRDVYGVPTAIAVEARKDKKFGVEFPKTMLVATAVEIASHAEMILRDRGLYILSGEPEEDEALKAAARAAWIKMRASEARRVLDLYRKRTLAFHQDPRNLGSNPPPMTERESEEQIWLDRYEVGQFAKKNFQCPAKCGFQHNDEETMKVHTAARHPNLKPEPGQLVYVRSAKKNKKTAVA